MPPGKRPSTGVAARKGRERPRPRAVHAAPGPTGGVAHAPMSVSEMCWGARVVHLGMMSENPDEPEPESLQEGTANLLRSGRAVLQQVLRPTFRVTASWFAVAPVRDCLGALGRVKGPLRRYAPLTRPARSRCVAVTGATARAVRFLVDSTLSHRSTWQPEAVKQAPVSWFRPQAIKLGIAHHDHPHHALAERLLEVIERARAVSDAHERNREIVRRDVTRAASGRSVR